MTNYKNLLQEYCQKEGCSLPIYHTTRLGEQKFASAVQIGDTTYQNPIRKSFKNKVSAEQDAAAHAIEMIVAERDKKKLVYQGSAKIGLILDIENKQKILEEMEKNIKLGKIEIHIFYSKNLPGDVIKKLNSENKYKLHFIDSSRSDAADTYMIFKMAELYKKYDAVGIITGDHFGETLAEILIDCGKKSRVLRNVAEIISFIKLFMK